MTSTQSNRETSLQSKVAPTDEELIDLWSQPWQWTHEFLQETAGSHQTREIWFAREVLAKWGS